MRGVGWACSWGVGRLEGGNGMFSSCGKTPMKLLVRVTELARPYWGQGHSMLAMDRGIKMDFKCF